MVPILLVIQGTKVDILGTGEKFQLEKFLPAEIIKNYIHDRGLFNIIPEGSLTWSGNWLFERSFL